MLTMINNLAKNKDLRAKLMQAQLVNSTKAFNVLKPCDTRWSSTLLAAGRIVQLESSIKMVQALAPSEEFWVHIKCLCEFLDPFRSVTDSLQKDTSTLFEIYKHFVSVMNHVKEIPEDSPFKLAKPFCN